MTEEIREELISRADRYNDLQYFREDPVIFPREFLNRGASLQDIEIAAVFAAHFGWGRRSMIVRDCERFFDFMEWRPLEYVMSGSWRDDPASIHRTIRWSDTAAICRRLREWYGWHDSLESLTPSEMRCTIFRQKEDPNAPNKKINMLRRWMVRRDGIVDLGLWKKTKPTDLIIPLDTHVHAQAMALELTRRKSKDLKTAMEITDAFKEIFEDDPAKGDFALFGYGVSDA